MKPYWPAGRWFVGQTASVLRRWRSGELSSREVAGKAIRITGVERLPVGRAAVSGARRIWPAPPPPAAPPSPPPIVEEPAAMRRLAARAVTLQTELEQAQQTIAHLRRVEAAYVRVASAVDGVARLETEVRRSRAELEQAQQTIEHLRRVEAAHVEAAPAAANEVARLEAEARRAQAAMAAAVHGVQRMMDHWQDILFEIAETTGPSHSAATLVIGDRPVSEVLATLVNLSEPAHGARPFQYMVPFLAERRPFPLPWRDGLQPLHIVDVGSEELATEGDMHAPLRAIAPTTFTGFDPFAPGATGEGREPVTVTRSDGTRIQTYSLLVADGRAVTFHINRYGPTSSLLDSNYELAGQFGLLKAALETVETRSLPSSRLDDVLCADGEVPRVDLLKIDVQGAAHTVLANAPRVLANTLVCHVEAEFSPVYRDEKLFGEIDGVLRAAGFCFVDFFSLGRQRYAQFESSVERAFHRGRTLWADCIYIRNLDQEHGLSADDLFRAALIVHACYNKQDLAAELLARLDRIEGTRLLQAYLAPTPEGTTQ